MEIQFDQAPPKQIRLVLDDADLQLLHARGSNTITLNAALRLQVGGLESITVEARDPTGPHYEAHFTDNGPARTDTPKELPPPRWMGVERGGGF